MEGYKERSLCRERQQHERWGIEKKIARNQTRIAKLYILCALSFFYFFTFSSSTPGPGLPFPRISKLTPSNRVSTAKVDWPKTLLLAHSIADCKMTGPFGSIGNVPNSSFYSSDFRARVSHRLKFSYVSCLDPRCRSN